ncbi:MAG TPA: Rv2175c family DNA-binding protein [Mycobacteriales bacterium]|nr:Rv2175c family DNA-binding protein [Mycobacteriales bacterium]
MLPPEVPDWLTLPDIAERLRLPVTRVRDLVKDRRLLALRASPDAPLLVPSALVGPDGPVKHLDAVIRLLSDAGYSDVEMVTWLFTEDPTIPGSPARALAENRGTEIKRRAQALGF